jgi:uncharacterized membrane protein YbaN (DUF454 family)
MRKLKETVILVAGWVFVFLGVLGLFLPFVQGVLFIMIGLAILSSRSPTIQRLLKRLESRYPHHHDRIVGWRDRVMRWFKKK